MDPLIGEILKTEGAATFITTGTGGPHLVATWNSYLVPSGDNRLHFPAGGYRTTESNLKAGSKLMMMLGSKAAQGKRGPGAGYRLTGTATFATEGAAYDQIKQRFPWARAVVVFTVEQSEQLL